MKVVVFNFHELKNGILWNSHHAQKSLKIKFLKINHFILPGHSWSSWYHYSFGFKIWLVINIWPYNTKKFLFFQMTKQYLTMWLWGCHRLDNMGVSRHGWRCLLPCGICQWYIFYHLDTHQRVRPIGLRFHCDEVYKQICQTAEKAIILLFCGSYWNHYAVC